MNKNKTHKYYFIFKNNNMDLIIIFNELSYINIKFNNFISFEKKDVL